MNLTEQERSLLATYHGNATEVRSIRSRLSDAGLKWCPLCHEVLPEDSFGSNGRRHQMACRVCSKNKKGRKYKAVGDRYAERTDRYRQKHPAQVRAQKSAGYYKRRALGMTGREAAYMSNPDASIQAAWDAIKNS
ncbi:MAG: hypothetical protein QNJ14_00990 [Woeseiaceae bacterium]|nr:hypothetical protein [Woeseiaceae bacterium]